MREIYCPNDNDPPINNSTQLLQFMNHSIDAAYVQPLSALFRLNDYSTFEIIVVH